RFLEGKPILAKRATLLYRASKFIKRHRSASLIACVASLAVAISILVFSMQSRAADARAKQFQAFANSTISDLTEELQQSPKSVEVQASLFNRSLKYLDELRQSSANDPRLLLKLSKAYERVADLEGAPHVAMLGKSGTALTSREKSLQTAIEAHTRLPDEESTRAVAEAYQGLGVTEHFLGKVSKAEDDYQHSIFYARNLWQQNPQDPERKHLLAMSYARLGDLHLDNMKSSEALKSFRAAFQIFGSQQTGQEEHDGILSRLYGRMAGAQGELGLQLEALS